MFKKVLPEVWAFDAEWVPDPVAGRSLYNLSEDTSDREVIDRMWLEGGATEEDPMPYLKTALCRVVSISAVVRRIENNRVGLEIFSLPRDVEDQSASAESNILFRFLDGIGKRKPQLVGYNSHSADIKIMIQRGIAQGIQAAGFCSRPDKPWEGADYFAKGSDSNVDLKDIISGWGKGSPSLHEISTVSGIPGKLDVDGAQVANMWLEGKLNEIVAYNECDAATTYLLWLRVAHFAGAVSTKNYIEEQQQLRDLLMQKIENDGSSHFEVFLKEWDRLRKV
jgi:predicted PolB exonuclease-like 3'-5' exonuclease